MTLLSSKNTWMMMSGKDGAIARPAIKHYAAIIANYLRSFSADRPECAGRSVTRPPSGPPGDNSAKLPHQRAPGEFLD